MIITHLFGGLGNQMFQYAAGLALAYQHRTVLKLDVSWFKHDQHFQAHNRYALSCFNISEQFATATEVQNLRGTALTKSEQFSVWLARKLRFPQYVKHLTTEASSYFENGFNFNPDFFERSDDSWISGNWQSERYFQSIEELLKLHFSFKYPLNPEAAKLAQDIQAHPSVAIHIRHGDYKSDPEFRKQNGVLDFSYYRAAIAYLRQIEQDAVFYIFSDEVENLIDEFVIDAPHIYVNANTAMTAHDDLRLMSLCKHQIIANSTFSWWAAWLNSNPDKVVIAPRPWFAASTHDETDLVPQSWTRLEAHYG